MLKGIDHRLNSDMLGTLRAMGHGDTIVLVDRNFPCQSVAAQTTLGKPLLMENLSASEVTKIILSVMPIDDFVDDYAVAMEVVGAADETPKVQQEVEAELKASQGQDKALQKIERFAFYEAAKNAYAVVQTGETRFYGCFIFKKGVIAPDDVFEV
ncbi:RbsD/FucU family protein [Cohaesibacter celericrescens]|uniref:Ribose ABC transporter n=1 Tax=Cohaesibacter celericrescens TaxID=2067669 RepID=A0A2N5XUB5_9HYPH|nr:RbsD/FucU domain-containing protein [Cohaesibacter celericrescens]PLW78008.1 ribose ABC transporter [Cohaesibacter celericrescens]